MAKLGKAGLKRALIAAEAERAKHPTVVRPDPREYPKLLNVQRACEKSLADFLRKAGFDAKTYNALKKEHSAELKRVLEKLKADAIRRAERAKDTIHSSIVSQTQALQRVSAGNPFFPFPSVSLDKPFLIWAAPHSNILTDSNIESFNSWAKIFVSSSDSKGEEKVSFYFLWENASDYYAIINANTSISATGHLEAYSTGGWTGIDPTSRYSYCVINAEFALWQWWNQPPTSTPYTDQELAVVGASSSFWDDSETADVSDGVSLGQNMFLVPPRSTVVVEVAVKVSYSNGYGHMTADFESGAYQITCPVVVVSVLTGQPVSFSETANKVVKARAA